MSCFNYVLELILVKVVVKFSQALSFLTCERCLSVFSTGKEDDLLQYQTVCRHHNSYVNNRRNLSPSEHADKKTAIVMNGVCVCACVHVGFDA